MKEEETDGWGEERRARGKEEGMGTLPDCSFAVEWSPQHYE